MSLLGRKKPPHPLDVLSGERNHLQLRATCFVHGGLISILTAVAQAEINILGKQVWLLGKQV